MDNAKTQARHWLLAAAVALFAAILCLGLVGCGPSEEEKAKQARKGEEEEEEQGVGQMFPDAVSFCTNDHCQL